MKVFISQPMRGYSDEEIKENKKKIVSILKNEYKEEVHIIDSFIEMNPPGGILEDQVAIWYLGESIKKLAEADIAVFGPGWDEARGCCIEEQVASNYNIRCVYIGKDKINGSYKS